MVRRAPARSLMLLALALVMAAPAGQGPHTPFSMTLPAGLAGPAASTSLMGTTYAYTAAAKADLRLMITTMPAAGIRARFGDLTEIQCVQLFLDELKHTHERFFVVAAKRPLAVGPAEFPRFRWTGDKRGKTLTGVLGCGELHGYYYAVHYVDDLKSAPQSFPAIRASLKQLQAAAP